MNIPTGVLPAVRNMKDFDRALASSHDTIILLESRLSQLKNLVNYTKRAHKDILLHFDLIQGLQANEYGMEFLLREVKPDGILSTRGKVISLARRHNLLAIQRMFLLDSLALENNVKLVERCKPDCIEVLPGLMPSMIKKIQLTTELPVIAGGLIVRETDMEAAFQAGAVAISTSNTDLWHVKHA
ncbi:MAG TPA: glycerol-3-phosphate responsive antiterminator [Bacillota bacterium]|nr:glycerol-3-phosphate responsive antiterminator [Bacillota bacterium]